MRYVPLFANTVLQKNTALQAVGSLRNPSPPCSGGGGIPEAHIAWGFGTLTILTHGAGFWHDAPLSRISPFRTSGCRGLPTHPSKPANFALVHRMRLNRAKGKTTSTGEHPGYPRRLSTPPSPPPLLGSDAVFYMLRLPFPDDTAASFLSMAGIRSAGLPYSAPVSLDFHSFFWYM